MPEPREYTVGWITALPIEKTAAYAFLDKVHPDPATRNDRDSNVYTLGEIADHNVVIASLPYGQYGLSPATRVGQDMLRTFPNIRLGLMVGIGAGAPSNKNDVRLGDVVVSAPANDGRGGVVQYDFGKLRDNGSLELTKHLNQPPPIFLGAVGSLISEYDFYDRRIDERIREVLRSHPNLNKKYQRPGDHRDRLYRSDYIHPHPHLQCEECCEGDMPNQLQREAREDRYKVTVHHGLIASSNQVLKDSRIRDKWAYEAGVLCFEMEAAGLMNDFPCLVVRGICDYADSHKNDEWQPYAAMTAAAYAKELLQKIPPNDVKKETRISDIERKVEQIYTAEQIRWLNLPNYSSNLEQARNKRLSGTGEWFITSAEFLSWKEQRTSLLWLRGNTGCGKTVLSSVVVDSLSQRGADVLYFFFDSLASTNEHRWNSDKTKSASMIRSLIHQLHKIHGDKNDQQALFSQFESGGREPTDSELMIHFERILEKRKRLWIVLDAMDECRHPVEVLDWMQHLSRVPDFDLHVFITSRIDCDINERIDRWTTSRQVVDMSKDKVQPDIELFIHESLKEIKETKAWASTDMIQRFRDDLKRKSDGMFMLVFCQVDILKACHSEQQADKALTTLPTELSAVYNRVLENIPEWKLDHAIQLLQLLIYSNRPMRVDEISDGLGISLQNHPREEPKTESRVYSSSLIQSYCSSFLRVVNSFEDEEGLEESSREIQLAHPSIKDHFQSKKLKDEFKNMFSESSANCSLARLCISYLSKLDETISCKETKHKFRFAPYASGHWMQHAAFSTNRDKHLEGLIINLLTSRKFSYFLTICDPESPESLLSYSLYKPGSALYYTCQVGLVPESKRLIQMNFDPNIQGGKYGTALQAACCRGNLEVVKLLVDANADVNPIPTKPSDNHKKDHIGHYGSPLQAACRKSHEEIAQYLLKKNASINFKGGRHGTALHATARGGNVPIAKMLLEAGALLNVLAGNFGTPIQAASTSGHLEMVQLLLLKGADPNFKGGAYGTPIYGATFHGHEAVVEELIAGGAVIDIQGNHELDPCLMPTGNNWMALGILADNHDASYPHPLRGMLNRSDIDKIRTPLYGASITGHLRLLNKFLRKGAQPNIRCGGLGSVLNAACFTNRIDIVESLLQNGADVDFVAGPWGTALHTAAFEGNDGIVLLLLSKGAKVNLQAGQYQTALQAACARGHTETVRILLRNGADANVVGNYGSPLQVACVAEKEEIVSLLLEHGAHVNTQCGWYGNALQAAAIIGHSRILNALLDSNPPPDVNAESGVYGTALFAAACNGHLDVFQILLSHGADINGRGGNYEEFVEGMKFLHSVLLSFKVDDEAFSNFFSNFHPKHQRSRFCPQIQEFGSVLSIASAHGHYDIVEELLKRGACVNDRGGDYGSALHGAVFNEHLSIVELLLHWDADANIQDGAGTTPLLKAAEKKNLAMVQILLDHGASPNIQEEGQETPLHISVLGEDESLMRLLLQKGADITHEGTGLGTALFRASLLGNVDMVTRLLEVEDIDVNHGGAIGTPFAAASFAGHRAIVDLLRNHGANNDLSGKWDLALVLAASLGYMTVAKTLLESGADVDSYDEKFGTAIELARRYGHDEIIDLLERRNADDTLSEVAIDEATESYMSLLNDLRIKRGDDHPRTVKIMANLAYILMNPRCDEKVKAISLLKEAYEATAKTLGEDAPQTIFALADLGMALASAKQIDQATESLYRATRNHICAYGPTPSIREASYGLALILAWQGEVDAAFDILLELDQGEFAHNYQHMGREAGREILENEIPRYFSNRTNVNLSV